MATMTGQNLLESIIESTGVTLNALLTATLTAKLQQMIDNGTYSKVAASIAVSGFSTTINDATEINELSDAIETNASLIEAAPDDGIDDIEFPPVGQTASYILAADATNVDEGATAVFTLTTENVAEGTEIGYTISGVDADDIDGDLTGTAVVGADGTVSIDVTLTEDAATEGEETLTMVIDDKDAAASIIVNDTSQDIPDVLALTADTESVDEGGIASFTLVKGLADTEYSYNISGVSEDDIEGPLNGTVTTDADGNATIEVTLVADRALEETPETLNIVIPNTELEASMAVNDTSIENLTPIVEDGEVTINKAETDSIEGQLLATDPEGDALTFTLDAPIDGLTLNPDGSYSFDPTLNGDIDALRYSAENPLEIVANFTVTDDYAEDPQAETGTLTITVTPPELDFTFTPVDQNVGEGFSQAYVVTASEPVDGPLDVNFLVIPSDGTSGETATADFNQGQLNPTTVTIADGETEAVYNVEPLNDGETEVPEAFQVQAEVNGDTFLVDSTVLDSTDPALIGKDFYLTTEVDVFTPTASDESKTTIGDDTFHGTIGNETIGAIFPVIVESRTLTTTDILDGGLGDNILNVTDIANDNGAPAALGGTNLTNMNTTNIQTVNHASVGDVTADLTVGFDGVTAYNVTEGADVAVETAETTDIDVSDVIGDITIDGGQNINVDVATADKNTTIGNTTVNNGTITVTDSAQGNGAIAIDGGTTITILATSEDTGAITVGDTGNANVAEDMPTGPISITQNLNNDATAALAGGVITVEGGTTVDVTVNANSIADTSADDADITIGAINVTGFNDTTDVTVTQNDNVTPISSGAVGGSTETASVKFGELKAGDAITISTNGDAVADALELTFTASVDLTAAEVAEAFAGLLDTDTQDAGGPTANGFYTGTLNGWTSDVANDDTVVFTSVNANANAVDLDTALTNISGESVDAAITITDGAAVTTAADNSRNTVDFSSVTVADGGNDSIATVTIDGYDDSTVTSDVLATLNLANAEGTMDVNTAGSALDLNVNDVDGNVDLGFGSGDSITSLNLTAETEASTFALDVAALKTFNVDASVALDLTGSTFGALESIDINGAGRVTLGDISGDLAINTFDASGNTGGVSATIETDTTNDLTGNIEEYIFSEGADNVTLQDADVEVDVTLAAGNDVLILAGATLDAEVDGGADTDTLVMAAADASAASASTAFESMMTDFERLEVEEVQVADGAINIDLAKMDDIDYVITNGVVVNAVGTTETSDITFTPLDQGQTVTVDGLTLTVDDAAGMTAVEIAEAFDSTAAGNTPANPAKGTFAGALSANWEAGDNAGTKVVTFTAQAPGNAVNIDNAGNVAVADASDPLPAVAVTTAGANPVAATAQTFTVDFNDFAVGADTIDFDDMTQIVLNNLDTELDVAAAFTAQVNTDATNWSAVYKGDGTVDLTAAAPGLSATPITIGVDTAAAGQFHIDITDVLAVGSPAGSITAQYAGSNAVPAVTETRTVTFEALTAGQTVTVDGVTLTATGDMTAIEVAEAFDSTASGATPANPVNGTFAGVYSADWAAGDNAGAATVLFTNQLAGPTADTLDVASTLLGAPTLPTVDTTDGGVGAVSFEISNMADNGTVQMQAETNGVDTVITMADATGDADTFNIKTNGALLNFGVVSVDDVELITVDATGAGQALELDIDSATTVEVSGSGFVNLFTTNADVLTDINSTNTDGLFFIADDLLAQTVTGGTGNDQFIAAGLNDVLIGGAGNDWLVGADLTSLTGGDGVDTFVINMPSNVTSYSTIEDLSSGDIIQLNAGDDFVASAIELDDDNAVFQDFANAAVNQLATDDQDAAWFQFDGNTFIVINDDKNDAIDTDFENGVDSIIKIAGVVDLGEDASYNMTFGTLELG